MQLCKGFADEIMAPQMGMNNKADFLADTVCYFKEHEAVDYHDFKKAVFSIDTEVRFLKMTTHYNIHILSTATDFKLTYRDGKFRKFEHLRGNYSQEVSNAIGKLFPKFESGLDSYIAKYVGKVVYKAEVVKPKTIFTQFKNVWWEFFLKIPPNIEPKFDNTEGAALKKIIAYLVKIKKGDEEQALVEWQLILDNWNELPEFYQKKIDLKKINSSFNVIIRELTDSISKKRGISHFESRKRANDIADQYF